MGNQQACCVPDLHDQNNFQTEDIFLKKFCKADLRGEALEIGNDTYKTPLTRQALLLEDFSHIYDEKFADENQETVIKLQASLRCFMTLKKFQRHLQSQEFQDSIQLPKYFGREENRETISRATKHTIESLKGHSDQTQTYSYHSGATYNGQWLGGMRHGLGRMKWKDGAVYEGTWECNQATQHGVFQYPNGDTYEGAWASNLMCGYGVYRHADGTVYRGNWRCGLMQGKGEETWQDGSQYMGRYIEGRKEDKGTFIWPDGSRYFGQWTANEINGYGTTVWKDGRNFVGQWKGGLMHGCGKYLWSDNKKFEGQYKDDKKEGYGEYTWPDGRLYKGYWKDGKQHGLAEYQTTKQTERGNIVQSRYGRWKNGRRVQWFTITPGVALTKQLHSIEETVSKEGISEGELRFHVFSSPQKHFETFAAAMLETNTIKAKVMEMIVAGVSKELAVQLENNVSSHQNMPAETIKGNDLGIQTLQKTLSPSGDLVYRSSKVSPRQSTKVNSVLVSSNSMLTVSQK